MDPEHLVRLTVDDRRLTMTVEVRPIYGAGGLVGILWRPVGMGGWHLAEVE